MESNNGPKMTVKILSHARSKPVLSMEAGKDFVDLLLSFLVLPVGTILARLASYKPFDFSGSLGSIVNVAKSVGKLDGRALYVEKSDLLTPVASEHIKKASLLQLKATGAGDESKPAELNYRCTCKTRRSYDVGKPCCRQEMTEQVWMAEVPQPTSKVSRKSGFVKKNSTFIVTDALEISPMSTISSIDVLNALNVENMKELESCEADVGAVERQRL